MSSTTDHGTEPVTEPEQVHPLDEEPTPAPEREPEYVAPRRRVVPDRPGEVVVAVDDRMTSEELARMAKRGVDRGGA